MSRALILRAVTKGLLLLLMVIALLVPSSQTTLAQSTSSSGTATSQTQPAAQSGAPRPRVLEFGAVWCAPCKKFAPIFEKVKSSYESKANFESYDIEKGPGPAFRSQYNIQAVPTVIILNSDGKVVFQHAGLMSEADLTAAVDKATKQ